MCNLLMGVRVNLAFGEIVIDSDGRNVAVAKKVIERKILGEFDVFLAHWRREVVAPNNAHFQFRRMFIGLHRRHDAKLIAHRQPFCHFVYGWLI